MAAQALTTPRAPASTDADRAAWICSWLSASEQSRSASRGVIAFVDMRPTVRSDCDETLRRPHFSPEIPARPAEKFLHNRGLNRRLNPTNRRPISRSVGHPPTPGNWAGGPLIPLPPPLNASPHTNRGASSVPSVLQEET